MSGERPESAAVSVPPSEEALSLADVVTGRYCGGCAFGDEADLPELAAHTHEEIKADAAILIQRALDAARDEQREKDAKLVEAERTKREKAEQELEKFVLAVGAPKHGRDCNIRDAEWSAEAFHYQGERDAAYEETLRIRASRDELRDTIARLEADLAKLRGSR